MGEWEESVGEEILLANFVWRHSGQLIPTCPARQRADLADDKLR
jgi:hypothetical protein